MTNEMINAYFTPLDYFFYLGSILVVYVIILQYKWTKVVKENILLLKQNAKGDGVFELTPIDGSNVKLVNKESGVSKVWTINDLSTIEVPYPAVGFLPHWLQKKIKMVIVSDVDLEPISNRSPNRSPVATPEFLGNLINEQVTAAIVTVNKEFMDAISKMGSLLNPNHFYLGIGIVIILLGVIAYKVFPIAEAMENLQNLEPLLNTLKAGLGL